MLNLTTTSSILRVTTGSAGTVETSCSYVDLDQTTLLPTAISGAANAAISTATTTTVVAAPGSGKTRNVTGLIIANDHASVTNLVTVEQYDGSNVVRHWKGTLGVNERVAFDASGYWTYYGSDGVAKSAGVLLGLVLGSVSVDAVTTPDPATLLMYSGPVAGRMILKYMLPDGTKHSVQDRLSEHGFSGYFPNTSATVGLNLGLGWTTGGTVSHPTPATTSPALYSQQKRTRWANVVTTTNQILGLRTATAEKRYWRGNASGLGGFEFHARFAVGLWPAATVRLFVGLNDSNAGWVISDTLTGNGCGLWHDTTDAATTLSFVTRDGTTATKAAITLANPLAAGQQFDFYMWAAPNGSLVYYKLIDLATGTTLIDTSTSTNLPTNTAFLGQELAMSNGTANVTVTTSAFELMAHQCHSDL
jgi:hypothetical protein